MAGVTAHLLAAAGAEVEGAQGLLFRPWARPTELKLAHIPHELPGVPLYGLCQQQAQLVQRILVTAFQRQQSIGCSHPILVRLQVLSSAVPCGHITQMQARTDDV